MKLNQTSLVDRHNRPSVSQKVALQAHFINNGVYQDPVAISGVSIFCRDVSAASDSFMNEDGLLDADLSSLMLMNFANSSVLVTNSIFDPSNYTPGTTASGIFRTAVGKYVVVLDGTVDLSGYDNIFEGRTLRNGASGTGAYWDFWTVKLLENSDYKVVTNRFSLYNDAFFVLTEPLILTTRNKLGKKYYNLGTKEHIKISTEITINNGNIDESLKNIFHDSVVTSGQLQIMKLNDEHLLNSYVEVSGYTDTASLVEITSDNTFLFLWDTSKLLTHPKTLDGTLGSVTGPYAVRLKYTLLDQTIVTDPMVIILKST